MGFLKWISRRGAVGGTARWAARGYQFFRTHHPECDDKTIFRMLIANRFRVLPDSQAEQRLLAEIESLHGLAELVRAILVEEAGYADNDPPIQSMFFEVIIEELQKKGVPYGVIFGTAAATSRSPGST